MVSTSPSLLGPAPDRCPDCGARLTTPRCPACGLLLTGPDAHDVWRIDQQLHALGEQRRTVIGRLRAASVPPTPAPSEPYPVGLPPPPTPPPPAPPRARTAPWPEPGSASAPAGISVSALLLGLGTGLLLVAGAVFTAVTWSTLGAVMQGLVLCTLTAGTGVAARTLRGRGLGATAEAVSVVAFALLVVDVHALREGALSLGFTSGPGGDPLTYWCVALVATAAVAWWFAGFSRTDAPRALAVVAAQIPVPLYVAVEGPLPGVGDEVLCLAQVVLAVVAVHRMPRALAGGARTAAIGGASALWLATLALASGAAIAGHGSRRLTEAGVVALAAAVAGLVAALWPRVAALRSPATGTATFVGLLAGWIALGEAASGDAWWPVATALALGVAAAATRAPRPWGHAPVLVATALGGVASLPLMATVVGAVAAAVAATGGAWQHDIDTPVRTIVGGGHRWLAPGLVLAHLAVVAGAVLATARRADRGRARPEVTGTRTPLPTGERGRLGLTGAARRTGLGGVAAAAAVVAPGLADVPLAVVVAGLAVATLAPMTLFARAGGTARPLALVTVAGLGTLTLMWASAAPATTVATLAAGAALAAVVTALALRDGTEGVALASVGLAVLGATAAGGLGTAAAGATPGTAWAVAAVLAAGLSGAVAALDPPGTRTDERGRVATLGEATAGSAHLVAVGAVVVVGGPTLGSAVLAVGALAAGAHALRPGRRLAAAWSVAEVLVLVWQRLAVADVAAVEAYTLPGALALAGLALAIERPGRADDLPSWPVHGPWLVAALAPTVLVALGDPGLVRPLGGLVAGTVVLVGGALTGRRAAVDVGAVTVGLLGLRQLAPVVAELPNWVTLGAGGVVLLVVGGTFERRQRDLAALRHRYGALR